MAATVELFGGPLDGDVYTVPEWPPPLRLAFPRCPPISIWGAIAPGVAEVPYEVSYEVVHYQRRACLPWRYYYVRP